MEELIRKKLAKEAADKELEEFVKLLASAKSMPLDSKPSKCSWKVEEKNRYKIESLEAYAIDACKNDDQRKTAGMVTFPTKSKFICFRLVMCFIRCYGVTVSGAEDMEWKEMKRQRYGQ